MGFFGIGGSDKKKDLSEGVVHDSKKDESGADDLLSEFEAQFGQGAPQNQGPQPTDSQVPPIKQSGDDFKPPKPVEAKQPQAQKQQNPQGLTQPSQQSAPPSQGLTQPTQQSAPQRQTQPSQQSAPQPPPHVQTNVPVREEAPSDIDLPDFDFDFHPSEPANAPRTPPPKKQNDLDLPDFDMSFAEERAEEDSFSRSRNAFNMRFEQQPKREAPPSPPQAPPQQAPSVQEPSQAPPPKPPSPPPQPKPQPERRDVFMRGGTLFVERGALIRHVHDLGDLRGLSDSTHEQFERIDEQSKEEKELLEEMKVAVHAVHEDLESVDELLFSGEQ